MSEAISGLPPPPPPASPRDAAVAVLIREGASGREVFWVKRGKALAYFGGFRAFPGGSVDSADGSMEMAATRELFEETGVLLVRGGAQDSRKLRARLLAGTAIFSEVLREVGKPLDSARLIPAGRWITPPYLPIRFDARFFLVSLAEGERAEVWPGELASGEWILPRDAISAWQAGQVLLHPPTLHVLRALDSARTIEGAADLMRAPEHVRDFMTDRVEFQQGVRLFPLRTPTLPPASHTNCYFLGNGELLIVDPGAHDRDEQDRLVKHLGELQKQGLRPLAIFLTHHHADHTGAVPVLRTKLGLPLWAHAETASRLGGADRLIADEEPIVLGGPTKMEWVALHTPGHARGHLCLFHPQSRAVLCGDLVANGSTIIIDPPEGNMHSYLESLARIKALPVGALYPAHGAPMADGAGKIDEYIAHRETRIDAIEAALHEKTPTSAGDVVAKVYTDVPEAIWPIAERSALASLNYLVEQGRAAAEGDGFVRKV